MMNRIFCLFFFICWMTDKAMSQVVVTELPVDSAAIRAYEQRTKLTRIDGKYIPRDLNDAMREMEKLMDPEAKTKFMAFTEEEARTKTHFSLGKYLNVRWSLQEGSRLSAWFKLNKIYNHDDMIDCIIVSYHRKIHDNPPEFEALATYYYQKQKKIAEEALKAKQNRDAKSKPSSMETEKPKQ